MRVVTLHRRQRSRGLTLIEVLIAATILFSTLVVLSVGYRATLAAEARATAIVEILTPVPMITSVIRDDLLTHPEEARQGAGRMLGVDYRFEAKTVRFEPPTQRFDPDTTVFQQYAPRFRLYDVKIDLAMRGYRRSFLYQELAWVPLEPQQ